MMRKFNLLITPVGGIIVVVIMAFSAVAGIVANFVSNQQSDLPAQTAARIDELQRAVDQTSANVGDIPAFELKETPLALPTQTEPDALIWWDATPEPPTPAPLPTTTPLPTPEPVQQVVYVVVTPTPEPVQQVVYLVATRQPPPAGSASVSTPLGQMPCSEIYLEWGGKDARAQQRDWLPWFNWFESIGSQERLRYFSMCGGVGG